MLMPIHILPSRFIHSENANSYPLAINIFCCIFIYWVMEKLVLWARSEEIGSAENKYYGQLEFSTIPLFHSAHEGIRHPSGVKSKPGSQGQDSLFSHLNGRHHARFGMLQDVTMRQPDPGMLWDETNRDTLPGAHQNRIARKRLNCFLAVALQYSEKDPVDVHGMKP